MSDNEQTENSAKIIANYLANPDQVRRTAIARSNGNDVGFTHTNQRLARGGASQILTEYGKEGFEVASKLREQQRRIYLDQNKKRTEGQIVGDSLVAAGQGFSGLVGSLASLTLSAGSEYVTQKGGNSEISRQISAALRDGALYTADKTKQFTGYLGTKKSDELQGRINISGVAGQLDKEQNLSEYNQDIADGANSFIAATQRVGKDVLDSGKRILNDPALLGDTTAQALGSLGPSAKLASGGSKLATKLIEGTSNQVIKRAAPVAGASAGIGVSEASGSYTDAAGKVMAMSHDDLLLNSDDYASLVLNGTDKDEARRIIADQAGQDAFKRQLPVAASLGVIANKFETAPLKSFRGSSVLDSARTVGIQSFEEAAQGGSSALNTNIAIRNNADRNQNLFDDVGDQIATGAIAGVGMSGTLATPSIARETASQTLKSAVSGVKSVVSNPTVQEKASEATGSFFRTSADAVDGISTVAKKAAEIAKPVTDPINEKVIKPTVEATKLKVVEPVSTIVEDIANRPIKRIQAERILDAVAVQETVTAELKDASEKGIVNDTLNTIGVTKVSRTVPDTFKTYVPENSTLIETVTGVLSELANPKTKIDNLSPTDLAYVSNTVSDLVTAAKDASPAVKSNIIKVLGSPDLAKVKARIKQIDLNTSQKADTEITPETVDTSVNVAKVNPANVNPDVANKILEQADNTDLSDEDIKLLKSASGIAQAVNNHRGQQVQISKDKNVALSQKPAYNGKEDKLPPVKKIEDISRSIQVSGFTDARGNRLRSVNDFAADLFQAIQNPNSSKGDYSFVDADGNPEDGQNVARQFSNFVTHMSNKVEALNKSFDNDGKSFGFTSLVRGEIFKKAGEAGSAKPVFYHVNSPKSVETAEQIHNDAKVAAEVYNILVETSPELFPQGKVTVPELKRINKDTPNADISTEPTNTGSDNPISDSVDETTRTETNNPDQAEDSVDVDQSQIEDQPELKPTYVFRDVKNAQDIIDWAKSQGFPSTLEASDLHVTSYYAKDPVDRSLPGTKARTDEITVTGGERSVELFGDDAVVLTLDSKELQDRYADAKADGVTSDFPTYRPHITISYAGDSLDLSKIEPYQGPIELGTETQKDIVPDAQNDIQEVETGVTESQSIPITDRGIATLFTDTYKINENKTVEYTDGASILSLIPEGKYTAFAAPMLQTLIDGANKRLETVKFSKKDPRSIKEVILSGDNILRIRDFKNTAIVNQGTGTYDPELISLAAMAVVDWMTSVIPPHPSRLQETVEDLGGKMSEFNKENDPNLNGMLGGVFARQTSEGIARDVLRLWNVTKNKDVPMVDSRGIVEGVVKELITVLSENTDLVSIKNIQVGGKTHQVIDVSKLRDIQKDMGIQEQNSTRKLLMPDDLKLPSIGQKIDSPAQTQNFGDVPLSNLERAALKAMQDTPHYVAEGISSLVDKLGFETMAELLGYKNLSNFKGSNALLNSLKGKNAGIDRNLQEAFLIYDTIKENTKDDERIPVYYPVSISKVGRHQFVGINPQNNKVLRDMITPVQTTLDMENKKVHQYGFWLTVAQASGINRVENEDHAKILENIQEAFEDKYGEAVTEVLSWMRTGEINSEVITRVMGTSSGMEALNSVYAVASLHFAQQTGTAASFETTLAFELDGKTDGPANMMSNFGQGLLSVSDYKNFNRVGYFLGRAKKTLNDYFKDGRGDLYETTAQRAEEFLLKKFAKASPEQRKAMQAATRFASQFGEFKITDNGQIEMVRNNAKNPMTKVVYKSGLGKLSDGIANELLRGLYETLYQVPASVKPADLGAYIGYPDFAQDIETLFGDKLPAQFDIAALEFTDKSVEYFSSIVADSIGEALFEAAKDVIGAPISTVNDTLVFTSQIQAEFVSKLFDKRFEELVASEKAAGRIKSVRDLTQAQYDKLVDDIRIYAPMYSNGSQTLSVGSFSQQAKHDVELSSNMNGSLQQKSSMLRPEDVKVKIIPYLSIGRGDAMMMNRFYGNPNAPTDTLPIFDGINIPVDKITEYAARANETVLQNWDQDVLTDVVNDFESFLRHVGTEKDILNQVFLEAIKKAGKNTPIAYSEGQLLNALKDMQKMNQARKEAFAEIALSVDHMGGSNTSYTRNPDKAEMSLAEINQLIQNKLDELNEIPVAPPSEYYTELSVTGAQEMTEALLRSTKDTVIRESVRAIRGKVPSDIKIVTGSVSELNKYRQDNFPADGVVITASGAYDTVNNTIFVAKKGPETLVHELIHASTFAQVQAHYEGETNSAVTRLEELMDEFMSLDFSSSPEVVQKSIRDARQAILKRQANNDAFSQAAALNEFMAWTLSNELIAKTLQNTRTNALTRMTKKVLNLLRKLMGGVPNDIFSNIVFNTKLLDRNDGSFDGFDNGNSDNGGDGNGGEGSGDGNGLTPSADRYTNFWIDLLKQKIADLQDVQIGRLEGIDQIDRYNDVAEDALVKLDFSGLGMSQREKRTFKAIHIVLATEMQFDPQTALAMGRIYEHVVVNLKPEMFTGSNAEDKYSTVMDLFGATKNDEGISDALAILLALSQTNKAFRNALDQIPEPESNNVNLGSLTEFLTKSTAYMMRTLVGSVDTSHPDVKGLLDALAENLIKDDHEENFHGLTNIMKSLSKADDYVKGALVSTTDKLYTANETLQESDRKELTKAIGNTVTLASSFLSDVQTDIAFEGIKEVSHMGQTFDKFVPVQEFISNLVGTDKYNKKVVALLDRTNRAISSVRQAYREEVPLLFQNEFTRHPSKEEWKTLHNVLGKTDFAKLFDITRPRESIRLLTQEPFLDRNIRDREAAINAAFSAAAATEIIKKSKQLAAFMNGQGAGHLLLKNAYAINKLSGAYDEAMTDTIDELVSLYALDGADSTQRELLAEMLNTDADAIRDMIIYTQALNAEEDMKSISEAARFNGYKGYIPNQGNGTTKVIIEKDEKQEQLEKLGYTRIGDYQTVGDNSLVSRGYYVTSVAQSGNYTQGVLQNVQDTYRGVDATTGLSVNGTTSGVISGSYVDTVVRNLNRAGSVPDPKEVLIPVFDNNGEVDYFERSINPDLIEQYTQPAGNMALMLGSWAGRQVEEKFAQKYNNELVDELKNIYDNRGFGDEALFVNIADPDLKDQIYKDSWNIIPVQTKKYIEQVFGSEGFWIKKDMINMAVGYREPTIVDVWTGKSRLAKPVQNAIRAASTTLMGNYATRILSTAERATQSVISAAKDIIVVRSLIVPYMNTQANVFQLNTRGVGTKDIVKGYREKFSEIETYNQNVRKVIRLEAQQRLSLKDTNAVRVLKGQIQTIKDENARMTIAPLIEAGAYKNISEGMTELDIELTSNNLGKWIDDKTNKLPPQLKTAGKYAILSKDTQLYKMADKAVQYGDFLAKSIYYDHLVNRQGMNPTEAMDIVNEEFVNFSVPLGRTHSYLESLGVLWFQTFKIKITKTAFSIMRNNPVRALITANTVGDLGSPVNDNLLNVIREGRLDYSTGWEMLMGAPELNPWVNLYNLN